MSPTLLEVTIAVLLLWLAWQIGLRIAPTVLHYFAVRFGFRDTRGSEAPARSEKDVTDRAER